MPNYAALIEYDGTRYHGWQRQANSRTIQEEIEKALTISCNQSSIAVTGSGRTDAGVHARGQVAHFSLPANDAITPDKLQRSLNGLLPDEIAILDIDQVPDAFHARFDARSRHYSYYVTLRPAAIERSYRLRLYAESDFDVMNKAARLLIGTHHFGAFCRTKSLTTNRVCEVSHCVWVPENTPGYWRFEIHANRFLHGMVRAIVGTLIEVGTGKIQVNRIPEILASRDRRQAGPAVAPHGLVLERVAYDVEPFAYAG